MRVAVYSVRQISVTLGEWKDSCTIQHGAIQTLDFRAQMYGTWSPPSALTGSGGLLMAAFLPFTDTSSANAAPIIGLSHTAAWSSDSAIPLPVPVVGIVVLFTHLSSDGKEASWDWGH